MSDLSIDQVTSILDGLFECEACARPAESETETTNNVVAIYTRVDNNDKFAITCDLSLANSLGAALTRIPPAAANEAIAEETVPENIGDNLYEVLNICSSILAELEGSRVVLDDMFLPGSLDENVNKRLDSSDVITEFDYELERYTPGRISIRKLEGV